MPAMAKIAVTAPAGNVGVMPPIALATTPRVGIGEPPQVTLARPTARERREAVDSMRARIAGKDTATRPPSAWHMLLEHSRSPQLYLLAERDIEARAGEIERVEPSLAMRRRNRRGAVTPVPIRLSGPGRRSDGFHAVASPVKRRIGGLVAVGLALAVATMVAVAPCRGALADYADGQSAFERGDWDTARSVWRPLAESGDAAAQNGLGYLFRHGRGVTQDSAAALLWYRRAAERGYAPAQFNLGLMYDHGVGVAQDFAVAALWFRRAAVQGIARAQTFLGFMYWAGKGVPGDRAKALFWLRRAAATDPMARQNLPALQSAATAAERANADALLDDWRETLKVPDAE